MTERSFNGRPWVVSQRGRCVSRVHGDLMIDVALTSRDCWEFKLNRASDNVYDPPLLQGGSAADDTRSDHGIEVAVHDARAAVLEHIKELAELVGIDLHLEDA